MRLILISFIFIVFDINVQSTPKAGLNLNVNEILRGRFKEGMEERKLFLEHQQTVDNHAGALAWISTVCCC